MLLCSNPSLIQNTSYPEPDQRSTEHVHTLSCVIGTALRVLCRFITAKPSICIGPPTPSTLFSVCPLIPLYRKLCHFLLATPSSSASAKCSAAFLCLSPHCNSVCVCYTLASHAQGGEMNQENTRTRYVLRSRIMSPVVLDRTPHFFFWRTPTDSPCVAMRRKATRRTCRSMTLALTDFYRALQ